MKTITFFNNKSRVGKTTLVYHVAWMYAELGVRVLIVDLDPQSNLTRMSLTEERLAQLWPDGPHKDSIAGCLHPILKSTGDIHLTHIESISACLGLIVGDLELSYFEDTLSESWSKCLDGNERAFRATTAFYRIMDQAVKLNDYQVVLMDIGPNLGPINRAALIASDHIIFPLSPGLFSLQDLKKLGPTLRDWRNAWEKRLNNKPEELEIPLPEGRMEPAGYVLMQQSGSTDRSVKTFQKWEDQVPEVYANNVLGSDTPPSMGAIDPNRIGLIKNYMSLMPMAQEALKPIFHLKPADGAIGAHAQAVEKCYTDFKTLTEAIDRRTVNGLSLQVAR